MKKFFNFLHRFTPIFLFIGGLLIFYNIYPQPRNWYDHYLYLTRSILEGRVDIPDLPSFYHDKLIFEGRTYIPFPLGASFLLIPFVYLKQNITQQFVSIIIGALDISLVYILLKKIIDNRKSILLSLFFAFGTPFFWSSVVGTTWFFAHVVAIFFLSISLIFYFNKKLFWSGIFFALASLTRMPIILSGIFFLFSLWKTKRQFVLFLLGAFIFIPITLGYDYLRFGNVFKTGYNDVYNQYTGTDYPYTISQIIRPNTTVNGYFDIKNVPMHLYTFLFMPPNIDIKDGIINDLRPSPFGMGILFTSPLIFLALKPPFKKGLELNAIITTGIVAIPSFLHVMQGWVQFGYRFILDFMLFLILILGVRFKITKLNIGLILFSIIINSWGVIWAINLGW